MAWVAIASSAAAQGGVDVPLASEVSLRLDDDMAMVTTISRASVTPLGFERIASGSLDRTARAVLPARTIRQALNDWQRLDPRYEWRLLGNVPVLRSKEAWRDRRDVLNTPVSSINWQDITVLGFLLRVSGLVGHRLDDDSVGTDSSEMRFSVSLERGTMLQLLNEAATVHGGFAWVVEANERSVKFTAVALGSPAAAGMLGRQSITVRR
jgi:hypothetical protein